MEQLFKELKIDRSGGEVKILFLELMDIADEMKKRKKSLQVRTSSRIEFCLHKVYKNVT